MVKYFWRERINICINLVLFDLVSFIKNNVKSWQKFFQVIYLRIFIYLIFKFEFLIVFIILQMFFVNYDFGILSVVRFFMYCGSEYLKFSSCIYCMFLMRINFKFNFWIYYFMFELFFFGNVFQGLLFVFDFFFWFGYCRFYFQYIVA